jgi:hypothetical protein
LWIGWGGGEGGARSLSLGDDVGVVGLSCGGRMSGDSEVGGRLFGYGGVGLSGTGLPNVGGGWWGVGGGGTWMCGGLG